MNKEVYSTILKNKKVGKKLFSVLIDPDKFNSIKVVDLCNKAKVDLIMVGGSIITNGNFETCIETIKKHTDIPVVIFPGNGMQINNSADAILLLSLISGRNPEMLIGNHVIAASKLKASKLEIVPTGYMLIDGGKQTSAVYMSNTNPIPAEKHDIAMATAMAGEMLGLKLIYMDGGSGAMNAINDKMIKAVATNISIPLIVGGGIKTPQKALQVCNAGADVVVIGNAIEKDLDLIKSISKVIHAI